MFYNIYAENICVGKLSRWNYKDSYLEIANPISFCILNLLFILLIIIIQQNILVI